MQFRNLMALSLVSACAAGFVVAQEKTKTSAPEKAAAAKAAPKEADKAEAKKPSARMPNYFPKLDLTTQQREKILNTLVDYNDQIDELEDQIKELREKRDSEVRAILTPAQKEKLAELEMDARKKRAEKADKSKKETPPPAESK